MRVFLKINPLVFEAWFLVLILSGCAVKKLSPETGNPKWGLDVKWHGHSCFTLVDSVDRTIVIDPFDETVGYGRIHLLADALFVTHEHFDHNNRNAVKARHDSLDMVQSTGTFTVAMSMQVTGVLSAHDKDDGQINGPNLIYLFVMGGLRCVFLGDLGTSDINEYQLNMIGKVDVIFIPVGGTVTLGPAEAKKVIDKLKPSVVFPMHYGNVRFYPLESIEKFTSLFRRDQVKLMDGSSVRLREADLTDTPVVYILQPTPKN